MYAVFQQSWDFITQDIKYVETYHAFLDFLSIFKAINITLKENLSNEQDSNLLGLPLQKKKRRAIDVIDSQNRMKWDKFIHGFGWMDNAQRKIVSKASLKFEI